MNMNDYKTKSLTAIIYSDFGSHSVQMIYDILIFLPSTRIVSTFGIIAKYIIIINRSIMRTSMNIGNTLLT